MNFGKGMDGIGVQWPLSAEDVGRLAGTHAVSPRVGKQHDVPAPFAYGTDDFDVQQTEVMEVRECLLHGKTPFSYLESHMWFPADIEVPVQMTWDVERMPEFLVAEGLKFRQPAGLANVVHMDAPEDMGMAFWRWMLETGKLTAGGIPFVEGQVLRARMLAFLTRALERAFDVKYYYGAPRPEEVLVRAAPEIDGPRFTHYREGCPNHPAYPAGHGTVAGATYEFFKQTFGSYMDQEALMELWVGSYNWAHWRTLARVHHAQDNDAGLRLGMRAHTL